MGITDKILGAIDTIEDYQTNHLIKNTAEKYDESLAQIILDELKPDKSKSYIHESHRYRSGNTKWVNTKVETLKRPEIIKIIRKYKDDAAESVMKVLGNKTISEYIKKHDDGNIVRQFEIYQTLRRIAEGTTDQNVIEIINKLKVDNPEYSWHIAENLAIFLLNTNTEDDKEIFKYITDTINHYDSIPALSISDGFTTLRSNNILNTKTAKNFYEIMTMDKIIELCKKYDKPNGTFKRYENRGTSFDEDTHRVYCIAGALSKSATYTHNKDITNLIGDIINRFDKDNIGEIAQQIGFICENEKEDYLKITLESINNIYKRDITTAEIFGKNAKNIIDLFGDKYKKILKYLEKSNDRKSIYLINTIETRHSIADKIKKIELTNTGKKQIKKLINLARYLDANQKLKLHPDIPQDLDEALKSARNSLEKYMNTQNITDIDKGIKFIPWIQTKDETALKALSGEKIEKKGPAKTYPLTSKNNLPLEDLRNDIKSYAEMLKLDIEIKEDTEDLEYLKNIARQIMQETDRRKDIDKDTLGEIKPNISRILNTTHNGTKNYVLCINPSDIESQMEALQNIESCLSPNGGMFEYTQVYMKNPNTFWATIREDDEDGNIVGRVTAFRGSHRKKQKITEYIERILKNQSTDIENTSGKNKDLIARASKVYSIVPVDENEVDNLFKTYAEETGLEFIETGTMFIDNLADIYDDFASGRNGNTTISRKKIQKKP